MARLETSMVLTNNGHVPAIVMGSVCTVNVRWEMLASDKALKITISALPFVGETRGVD